MRTILFAFLLQASCALAQVGQSIPAIALKNLDGDNVSSASFYNDGKPIILSFWETSSNPSKVDLNAIAAVYEGWQQQTGVKLIAIAVDDARSSHQVRPYVESRAWQYEVYLDENQDLKRALNVSNTPHTFVLNGSGKIVNEQIGAQFGNTAPLLQMVQAASVGVVISGGGLALAESGGVSRAGNLALGKTAFAQNEIGIAPHAIAKVNDRLFGNANSWIAGSPDSFVGVVLGTVPVTLDRVAFGRDNVPAGATDRTLGLYTLEFTTASDPTSNTAAWTSIGTLDYQSSGGADFPHPSHRHEFSFTPVSATGFRIRTSGGSGGRCVDELELYAEGYATSGGGIALVAEYGSIAPNNLATGRSAFAKDEIGIAPHAIPKVNDGLYGNANSWIAGSADSVIGINLGTSPLPVGRVAFGRGNNDVFFDRVYGLYRLQYTTTPNPSAAIVDANWTTIGTIRYDYPGPNFLGPRHRHEFTFDPVMATGFRMKTLTSTNSNIAIDELELYSPITPARALWRQQNFGSSSNSGAGADTGDADADGLVNLLEYAIGQSPFTPSAMLPVQIGTGTLGYRFNGVPDLIYGAETSADLVNWTPLTDQGTGRGHVFTMPVMGTKGYLRLKATPTVVAAPTVIRIFVTPNVSSAVVGATQAFTATGVYSDGTTQDLTTQVTWSSSANASISNAPGTQGLATALVSGTASIMASLGALTGSATLDIPNNYPSNNETNREDELDYAILASPTSINVSTGNLTPVIYANVSEAGLTHAPGASPSISCQIGYGPAGTNPTTQAGWTWVNASFDSESLGQDIYRSQFVAPAPGSYRYAARLSRDGIHWTYADANGAGSNACFDFNAVDLPVMEVQP